MKVTKEDYLKHKPGFSTRACHGNQESEKVEKYFKDIVAPISVSTTFKQTEPGKPGNFDYSRMGNPSRVLLESYLAAIENCRYALCFSSGLGVATSILFLLSAGDNVVFCDDRYGGVDKMFSKCASNMNITTTFLDPDDMEMIEETIKPNTKIIWLETPTDPLLRIIDIRRVVAIAQKSGGILVVVDNTSLTPYFQRPLELGADISVYSLTKYINGHSDVVMGALCTNNEELYRKLNFLQKALGVVPGPMDCHQVSRSIKTLALRMEQHMKNGLIVGRFLESHVQVDRVLHPGLPSHPQHALLKKQCYGYSGMMGLYLKGGLKESKKFLSSLKIIAIAESFGGCESVVEIPSLMSHSFLGAEEREKLGLSENLIRLSVGIEDPEDLVNDLEQALAK